MRTPENEPRSLEDDLAELITRCWGKPPQPVQMEQLLAKLKDGMPARNFVRQLVAAKPFRERSTVRLNQPPGHYFSPVVDPALARDYFEWSSRMSMEDIKGIEFSLDRMLAFWRANEEVIRSTPFGDGPTEGNRYMYLGGPYPYGDAITLRAMIHHYQPRRIVEIGSGYSTACMLDSADHAGLNDTRLTCIDPDFTRLRTLLKPGDEERLQLHERVVQGMSLEIFEELEANDILFIDSTHVLKTGSDVHYELFTILPALKPGVVVHFHDCLFPMEYSRVQAMEKNHSWNEVYALRALLMYSKRFRPIFYSSLFAQKERELIARTNPDYLRNPGSGLWIEVCQ